MRHPDHFNPVQFIFVLHLLRGMTCLLLTPHTLPGSFRARLAALTGSAGPPLC